jgi:hypothetical protein
MPTLDDQFLDTLLHETGDSFTVPASGPAAILRRVHHDDHERSGLGGPAPESGESGESGRSGEPAEPSPLPASPRTIRGAIKGTVRTHRMLAVAASVLILLFLAGGGVWLDHGTPKTTAGLQSAPTTRSSGTRSSGTRSAGTRSPSTGFGVEHTPASSGQATESAPSTGSSIGSATASAPAVPSSASTSSKASNTQDETGPDSGVVGQPARIEQTGSLDLTVARGALSSTVGRLNALATANGGFVANSQTNTGAGGAPSGTVTLEVPVASFSAVLRQAESFGKVSQLTTSATDVTAQYVDLQSQITALEASRQQYLTIMTKAASIGDVLAVQAQLDTLQSQIQQLQGQLAVLGSETDYSKLTTAVSEAGQPHHHHPAGVSHSGLARAWHDSVHGFVSGAEGLVRIAGPALFALLCLGAVLFGGQLFWRRLQRRNL